jgi:hypothetical protein
MRATIVLAMLLVSAFPVSAAETKSQLHCVTGPIEKTYGGTKWLVHSCSDGKSLVFTAEAGPAAPFEFDLTYTGKGYDLDGRGKTHNKVTDAAYAELQKLRSADILKLIQKTKRVTRD